MIKALIDFNGFYDFIEIHFNYGFQRDVQLFNEVRFMIFHRKCHETLIYSFDKKSGQFNAQN